MSKSYIGKVIDNYRILESLGIGGMGVVFKAINTKLDKLVALKMIAPGLAMNEDFIKRFQKEAKALAKLADPNIVSIYDLRQENDQWYIVMEYIDGPNLSDLIQKKKGLSVFDSTSILKQLLRAIGHAHQANIIHRDIKPNNIMINSDGVVKITDFGLSKDQSVSRHTVTVQSGGTLYYMSPEHVKGFSFTDKRSDIYSIGMTFYEMITGNVPFQNMETDFDIRESIVRKDFIKPSHFNPKIPKPLEMIIMKSIAKKPDDRYQSAEEMMEDVQRFEASLKGTAALKKRSSGHVVKKKKSTAYSKTKFRISAFILSAVTVITLLTLFFVWQKKESNHDISQVRDTIRQDTPSKIAKMDLPAERDSIKENDSAEKPKMEILTESPPVAAKTVSKPSTGTLFVASDPPGSKIYINNRYMGETPYTLFGIKAGQNALLLKEEGYADYSENISIRSGQKYSLNKKLVPLTGNVLVKYEPAKVTIKLDGKILNENDNPLLLSNLKVGKHNLEILKPGFSTFSKNIEIIHQQTTEINATLTELIGKLSVRVKPWGSIYIDNQIQKANTDIKFEKILPEKDYMLKIVHPTFGEWEKKISIINNHEEDIVVDFTKTITVQVNALDTENRPVTAKIIVDNKPTNFTTPENIQVRPGIHSFLVEKEGFIATEDRKQFLVDHKFNKQITFVLKKVE